MEMPFVILAARWCGQMGGLSQYLSPEVDFLSSYGVFAALLAT